MAHPVGDIRVNPQHMCHPEIAVIPCHRRGLTHADQRAALIHPLCQCPDNIRVLPRTAAAPRRPRRARVDHHIHIFQRAALHILETDEADLQWKPAERFIDMYQIMHVCLVKMAGQRP